MGNTFVLSEADKKNIIDELVKKAAEKKKTITLEDCYKILTLAKEMNRKYEELNNIVAPKIQALIETSSEEVENYIKFKALNEEHQKIKSFLVDGYKSLQNIRQIFTNEKIDYQVAILGKRTSYEFILSEKEFLDMAQLFYETKGEFSLDSFKIRVGNYGETTKAYKTAENRLLKKINGHKTVWGAVREFFDNRNKKDNEEGAVTEFSDNRNKKDNEEGAVTEFSDKKKKKKKKKKDNEGNIYETYRNILANRQGKNEIPPLVTTKQIEKAFSAVKSGTQSSIKGGDTLLEQDKVVSKHASIINVNLVHTTFVKIENIFENFIKTNNRQDFIDSLQSLFVNNTKGRRTIDKLTKALESDARQAIEDIIQAMPLDIT